MKDWSNESRDLPYVCGIKTYNSGPTIYACLQAASKTFENIIVTDDGSKDETINEISRFISDNPDINIAAFDVDNWDPMPDMIMKRDHGNTVDTHPTNKSHSKAQIKNFQICKHHFPNAIYFSLEDDVILYEDIRQRISGRISNWIEPETDCEFFNVANVVNEKYLHVGKNHVGMNRRKLYENAGDWTFGCFWTGGKLSIGPDPVWPWGACIYPWMAKNQTGKKGQDDDLPYGNHLLYYRRTRQDYVLENPAESLGKIEEIKDPSVNVDCFSDLEFKIKIHVDEQDGHMSVEELV